MPWVEAWECPRCGELFREDQGYAGNPRNRSSGKRPWCRACESARVKAYRQRMIAELGIDEVRARQAAIERQSRRRRASLDPPRSAADRRGNGRDRH